MNHPQKKQTVACVLLVLAAGGSMAADGWDCHRGGADGKEWVCGTDQDKSARPKSAAQQAETTSPENAQTTEAAKSPERDRTQQPTDTTPQGTATELTQQTGRAQTADKAVATEKAEPKAEENPQANTAAGKNLPRPGWTCRASAGKEWDCNLIGADPRGEAHSVSESRHPTVNWAQSGDMTKEDEQRFSGILQKMPANPWVASCTRSRYEWSQGSSEFFTSDADRLLREHSPLEIQANQAELLKGETSNFQGSAELIRADQKLYGNFVTHNQGSGVVNAQGNVIYREKGLSFASDTAFMDLDKDQGVLRNSQFILEGAPARGTSRITHIESKSKSRYETATYTTCPPGDQSWVLHATNATIDKESGEGSAKNAWLEFKGVPFLYTPWMNFPVSDKRKSGLLAPYFGYSKQNGFDFTLPYYFNLAPNYDFTFMPRYLSERGILLRGDFRYLDDFGQGRMVADIVPWDSKNQETRGQVGWVDKSRWTDHIDSQVDLHLISDPRYIYELGNLLAINSSTFLRSWAQANYTGGEFLGGSYSANLMADYYQSMDPAVQNVNYPYRRLPQLTLNYNRDMFGSGLQFQTSTELANFDQQYKVHGQRMNIRPRVYYPFRDSAGYITPSLALQHTQYWLQNTGPLEASSFSRTAPIFSLDSGAYFDNDFTLFNSPMQQTLEPRLFYLYVPKVDQPYNYNYGVGVGGVGYQGLNFDTAEYDFNFYQLFRENRFAGNDRLSDANNITPALTSRLISQKSGLERLKLSVGKVFYLTDPQVVLVPNGPQTTNKDNIIGEFSSMLSEHWSLRGTGQWNYNRDRIDRGQLALQYNNLANHLINLSYRYRRDPYAGSIPPYPVDPYYPRTINQTDVSTRMPIGGGWFGIGRWQYDLASQITVQSMLGVEKETCCWRFSLVGLHYANGATGAVVTPSTTSTQNAIYFQFELKGLGRLGDQIDQLLMQNFSGYRSDNISPVIYP